MLTAHNTVKTAWSKFKTYPRFKQIILFNFVAMLPAMFLTVFGEQYLKTNGIGSEVSIGLLNLVATIPSYIVYFLTGMSITHYVCGDWVFNSFSEFCRPPSSRWKLFWKAFALYFVLFLVLIIAAGTFGALMAILPTMGQILIGTLLVIVGIGAALVFFTKLILVNPYFTMNDEAPLLSPLKFSDGYFWYLSKILGWMLLYGILFVIAFVIIFALVGFVATMIGTIGIAVLTCVGLIIQAMLTMVAAFIYSETYKQIAENKS